MKLLQKYPHYLGVSTLPQIIWFISKKIKVEAPWDRWIMKHGDGGQHIGVGQGHVKHVT